MSNIVIKQLSDVEIDNMGILNWPIWTCEVSEFPWQYDVKESCLILDGEVYVAAGSDTVQIKAGDFCFSKRIILRLEGHQTNQETLPIR